MHEITNNRINNTGLSKKVFVALKVTIIWLIAGSPYIKYPTVKESTTLNKININEKNRVASILPINILDLLYGLINNNLIVPFSVSLVTSPEIIIIVKITTKIVQIFNVK